MDTDRPAWPVGAALLGILLLGLLGLGRLDSGASDRSSSPHIMFPEREHFVDRTAAVQFGWSISPRESEPKVWAVLPGVGKVLAGRLARQGALGTLRSPPDLLRVRGIGFKMAAQIEPWVEWPEDAQE